MQPQTHKCVMVIDASLPLGLIANTAAIMGVTLGKHFPQAVGPDVTDRSGSSHLGIISVPVPVLCASAARLREIRSTLFQPAFSEVVAVDFSDVAQSCNDYDDYIRKAAQAAESELQYFGVGICGPKKLVNKLTGSLPLLR